jgi:uncharacterized protein (DUF1501 family)
MRTHAKLLALLTSCLYAMAAAAPSARAADFVPFVLVVYASGGWDQTMVFDPKIESGFVANEDEIAVAKGKGDIPFVDHPDRPAVKTFFETYGDHATIVNGLYVGSMSRSSAAANVLGTVPPEKSRAVDYLSYYTASLTPVMTMPHVVIDAPIMPGDYASVTVKISSDDLETADAPPAGDLGDDAEAALDEFRKAEFGEVHKPAAKASLDGEKLRALYYGFAREAPVRKALAKVKETLGSNEDDGESELVRAGKAAVELFANGASQAATIQAFGDDAWDTFEDSHARQSVLFQDLFAGLNTILDYADARGVASRLTLVVVSDGGKSPQLNAKNGKGPWPYTSMLLWGVGIRGASVAGLTDRALRGIPIDPIFGTRDSKDAVAITAANVWAALYLKTKVTTEFLLPEDTAPLTLILNAETDDE